MSKINLLTGAVIGLFVLNACLLAFFFFSKPGNPGKPPPVAGEGPRKIIIERLHFTPEQQQQYETLIQAHRHAINDLDRKIRDTKQELYNTLSAKNDVPEKDSLLDRVSELQKKVETVHYEHFISIRKLCKPEQLPYFNDLTAELAKLFSPGKFPPGENNFPPPPRD